jgi:hypothetical protein
LEIYDYLDLRRPWTSPRWPAFKDAKLFPGGAREWDWSETGTAHVPGIQPTDVTELLEHGATVVVLSKGVYERLRVCPETLKMLSDRFRHPFWFSSFRKHLLQDLSGVARPR